LSSGIILEVNRFSKFILLCVFFAAICVAKAEDQVSSLPETNAITVAVETAQHEADHVLVSPSALTVFNIGPLPVTNSMICTWIVALIIFVIIRATTWKVKEIPSVGQNFIESIVEGWENLMGNVLEPKVTRWVFPLATTYLIFIVVSNFTDLLPGMGSIGLVHSSEIDKSSSLPFNVNHVATPFFRPPTTDANLTVAMAGIFFVMCLYWALKYNGPVGLLKHIFGVKVDTNKWMYIPLLLLFIFIGVMESFSILFIRPVALALRLYGNIFGGETMLTMAMSQKSVFMAVLLSLPGYFFETVVCLLQAFVFAMLSVAFVGTLCTHADEEHSH
jgi:F-type H+-transporting ATPase subunit a